MEVMLTNNHQRIRVNFEDDGILTKTQTKQGLKHSWVLLKPHFTIIADIISHITHSFQLHLTCPRGIILSIDGFVLPPFESTAILKDTDLICVKRKRTKLQGVAKAIKGTETSIDDAAQQPLPSGIKLLTHKEHDEETGSYQSDTDENDDKGKKIMLPLENASGRDVTSKKRKASSEIESLKTKKQRQLTPKSAQKKHDNCCERTPRQKSKVENRSQGDSKAKPEVIVKRTKKLKSAASESKEDLSKRQEEKAAPLSQTCDGAKKVSRATRRKKLRRMWRKINREKEKLNKCEGQLSAKALDADPGPNKSGATNIIECQQVNEESDQCGDLVPVEIRPGHIRFTPSNKVKDVPQNETTNGGDVRPTDNTAGGNNPVKSNGWNARANKVSKETFQWNGISNKRKGQKWGTQKQSAASWEEPKDDNVSPSLPRQFGWKGTSNKLGGQKWGEEKQPSSSWKNSRDYNSWGKEKETSSWKNSRDYNAQSSGNARKHCSGDAALDFEKLVPLTDLPKVGDVFAYRLLELSSSWCPELSSFRIGKVARFEQEPNRIVLVPDPIYPLNIKKRTDDNDDGDDDSGKPPASSMYNEDGTLEIDFPSLVDVRVVKRDNMFQPGSSQTPAANGRAVPSETTKKIDETQVGNKNIASVVGNGELDTPTPVNGKKDVWEEISEALSAKKAQLSQDDCWKKKQNSANRSWSNRSLRGSALGPTMAMLRAQNGL